MNRAGQVFCHNKLAGMVFEDEEGYGFVYETEYMKMPKALPISLTLPLQTELDLSQENLQTMARSIVARGIDLIGESPDCK